MKLTGQQSRLTPIERRVRAAGGPAVPHTLPALHTVYPFILSQIVLQQTQCPL